MYAYKSQVCPYGGGPARDPQSNVPELAARPMAKHKTTEGLSGDVYEIPL